MKDKANKDDVEKKKEIKKLTEIKIVEQQLYELVIGVEGSVMDTPVTRLSKDLFYIDKNLSLHNAALYLLNNEGHEEDE